MALLLGLAVGVQVGRSLANLVAGAGWTWPVDQATFWRSLPQVAAGNADAGLPTNPSGDAAAVPTNVAGRGLLWTGIGLVEVLLLAVAGWVAIRCLQRWGPGRLRGMATSAEAEQMLGLTRLRKVSSVVRPDLHGKHANAGPDRARVTGVPGTSERGPGELGRGLSSRFLPGRFGIDPDPDHPHELTADSRADSRADFRKRS
ncbi:MAG: hypothetical protein WKF79_00965 [Nocardioides sp.]